MGCIKRATLTECLLKRVSWRTALSLTKTRAKGIPPDKNITCKKELRTLTLGNIAEGRWWSRWRWWWVRTSRANHKPMWQHFGVLRVKHHKANLIRQPSAYICRGGGVSSHLTPVTWYRNGRSKQHSRSVIRPTWRTARNFIFYKRTAVRNILQYYFLDVGKTNSQDWFLAIHIHVYMSKKYSSAFRLEIYFYGFSKNTYGRNVSFNELLNLKMFKTLILSNR
jgi:hypothetical protein